MQRHHTQTGIETIAHLKTAAQPVRTIIVSGHNPPEYAPGAVQAGVDGFVAKHRATEDLFPLLEQLAPWRAA